MSRSPAFEDALIMGVGAAARRTWELLTGEDAVCTGVLDIGVAFGRRQLPPYGVRS